MKRIRIEIQVTLLAVFILIVVLSSGYLVYQSLFQIVNTIHKEAARPDLKLMLVKEIDSDLSKVENTVWLYTLSNNKKYLLPYSDLKQSIEDKLVNLQDYSLADSTNKVYLDSMQLLTSEKLVIWDNILNLHATKADASASFSEYYQKIDTTVIEKDTIYIEEEQPQPVKKKGLFKRIFGKKEKEIETVTVPKTVIVDNPVDKEKMKADIAAIEEEIEQNTQRIAQRETALIQQNIKVTDLLRNIIWELEKIEKRNFFKKTQQADVLASVTYKRLALFTGAAVFLMILVLILFYRDLRKSRAYQKILQKAKNEAEKLVRAKELFVASVSHEMRTPVNAIYGLTEQILRRKHDAKTRKDIDVIHKSTRHLITLVNDTFDFSKIENQKLQLEPIDFLLDELFDDIIIYNKKSALDKGIHLILDKNNTSDIILFTDPVRLKQILINLLTNAIKFTDKGKVTLKASCDEYANSITLNVEVSDTGIGIPAESLQLIFNDFVQLETDITRKAKGTGLGLYLVKQLVDLLGGQINVESKPNIGSTFKISIPFSKGNADNIQSLKPEIVIPDALKKIKVLIVDDEEFNRHLLKNILNAWGLKFKEVENGKEAVEFVENNEFDLILMDIRMPLMDGFEATQAIKAMDYPAKIIALTANKEDGNLKKYEEVGFDNYIHKPYTEKELLKKINETLKTGTETKQIEIQSGPKQSVNIEDMERMANGDWVFMREMINIFITSSQNSIESIEKNFEEQNWQEIADTAHKMAAPAKHMNLMDLHGRIKQIQQFAESEENLGDMNVLIIHLRSEVSSVNESLGDLLEEIAQ